MRCFISFSLGRVPCSHGINREKRGKMSDMHDFQTHLPTFQDIYFFLLSMINSWSLLRSAISQTQKPQRFQLKVLHHIALIGQANCLCQAQTLHLYIRKTVCVQATVQCMGPQKGVLRPDWIYLEYSLWILKKKRLQLMHCKHELRVCQTIKH